MVSSGAVEVGPFVPLLTALLVRGLRGFLRVSVPLLYWAHCVSSFSIEAHLRGLEARPPRLQLPRCPFHTEGRGGLSASEVMYVGLIFNQTLFSDDDFCLTSCQNSLGCFSLFSKTLLCTNLIISLREFLSSDITGLEGVTSVKKALDTGRQAPCLRQHSPTFPADQQQQFPVLLPPAFVFILTDQKAKTVSVF